MAFQCTTALRARPRAAELLLLSLLERTPDFAALAVVNAPAEAMAQFRVVELGQDAPAERRVVDVVKNVYGLGDAWDSLQPCTLRGLARAIRHEGEFAIKR